MKKKKTLHNVTKFKSEILTVKYYQIFSLARDTLCTITAICANIMLNSTAATEKRVISLFYIKNPSS